MVGTIEGSVGVCSQITHRKAFILLAAALLSSWASVVKADFNFVDFSSVADLTLNGNAAQSGIVLRVTPDLEGQAGSAWYTTAKQHVSDGFDTTFGIRMTGGMSGDGMAFVIQDESTTALGGGGSDLGYTGITRSLAIEFDAFGFFPETENHISVQTRGVGPNSSGDQYSLAQVNIVSFDLNDGQRHDILIRYRPGILLIFVDGANSPILDIAIDLQNLGGDNILDGSGDAWVGFTAGTGAATENHDVEFWSFDEAAFALASGPCCTLGGCVIATAHDCKALLNGFYAGPDNGDCGSTVCSGPCCTGDTCEQDIALSDCVNNGGTFMGVRQGGAGCDPGECDGACCDPIGECFITSQSDCELNYLGTFHGPGTSCGPFPCTMPAIGACCDNNECLQMTESDCANIPGIWYGLGTNCLDVNCFDPPPPLGACCQPGNTCVDGVAETVCTHFHGVYQGDASLCVNANCAQVCDCQNAAPLSENSFNNDSTVGAPICDGSPCAGPSPAKIYSFTPSQSGYGLINTCNGSNFDSVISVHSGCPMTPANQIACDLNTCGQDAQVYFCVTGGQTYYVRVGGEGGSSGDYALLTSLLVADIFEGPFQNPVNGHWYYHTTQGPWTSLEQLAVSKGGHLVTINDAAENEWVRARFAEGTAVSIGINDAAVEGTFAWTSGQPVTYTNWALGEPNDTGDQDYGLMLSEGVWRDETSCFAGLYRGVIEVTTVPLPAILAGPITNPANCHQYYITQTGTWVEGQLKAQSLGGNLVTIDDAAENEFVRATFANYGGQPHNVWIGLSDAAVENTFTWADGSPVGYTAWNAGEPNNIGNEDYVVMNDAVTGGWNDAQSGGPFYAVIEVPMNCPCTCLGDLTGDLSVRGNDIQRFISCYIAANGGAPTLTCDCADVNDDGFITSADIGAMVTAALNGPACPP